MLTCPASIPLSTRSLTRPTELIRARRRALGGRWRRLPAQQQALMALAHLRNGDTLTRLVAGLRVVGWPRYGGTCARPSACSPAAPTTSPPRCAGPSGWRISAELGQGLVVEDDGRTDGTRTDGRDSSLNVVVDLCTFGRTRLGMLTRTPTAELLLPAEVFSQLLVSVFSRSALVSCVSSPSGLVGESRRSLTRPDVVAWPRVP